LSVQAVFDGFASSAHGIPRSTNDIDIVIAPTPQQLQQFLEQFAFAEFAVDSEDAFDALKRKSLLIVLSERLATIYRRDKERPCI